MVKAQECKVALDLVHVWSYKGGISPFGKPRSNGGASLSGAFHFTKHLLCIVGMDKFKLTIYDQCGFTCL